MPGPLRMPKMIRITLAALLASSLLGCQTTGPIGVRGRSAGPRFASGAATEVFEWPRDVVEAALRDAMDGLGIIREGQPRWEALRTRHQARAADGRRVSVVLEDHGPSTAVSVRVGGPFGDEAFSRSLLEAIDARLARLHDDAAPEQPPVEGVANPYFSRNAVPDAVMLRDYATPASTVGPVP